MYIRKEILCVSWAIFANVIPLQSNKPKYFKRKLYQSIYFDGSLIKITKIIIKEDIL